MDATDLDPRSLDRPTVALAVVLVATNLALVVGLTTAGAALGPYNGQWDGGSTLRSELDAGTTETVVATETSAYGTVTPESTVAVVPAPERTYDGRDVARLDRFLAGGGTLVVAGEGSGTADDLLAALGVATRLNGTTVLDEQYNDGAAVLPRAETVDSHSLVDGVDRLTLSRGTVLDVPARSAAGPNEGVTVLARTSNVSYLDRNGNGTFDGAETLDSYPVAAVESVGDGRVVVVSDATLLANALLDREGNRAFVGALATPAETAVLDYSHGPALAPLSYLLVVVRKTPLLQALVGVAGLAAVGLWARRPTSPRLRRVLAKIGSGRAPWLPGGTGADGSLGGPGDGGPGVGGGGVEGGGAGDGGVDLDEAELAAVVQERHPEWDPERVERVSQTIIRRRRE